MVVFSKATVKTTGTNSELQWIVWWDFLSIDTLNKKKMKKD